MILALAASIPFSCLKWSRHLYAYHIYIFEFKLHGTAAEALKQIHDKQYAAPFQNEPRQKMLVGVEFSAETRNIGQWLVDAV